MTTTFEIRAALDHSDAQMRAKIAVDTLVTMNVAGYRGLTGNVERLYPADERGPAWALVKIQNATRPTYFELAELWPFDPTSQQAVDNLAAIRARAQKAKEEDDRLFWLQHDAQEDERQGD